MSKVKLTKGNVSVIIDSSHTSDFTSQGYSVDTSYNKTSNSSKSSNASKSSKSSNSSKSFKNEQYADVVHDNTNKTATYKTEDLLKQAKNEDSLEVFGIPYDALPDQQKKIIDTEIAKNKASSQHIISQNIVSSNDGYTTVKKTSAVSYRTKGLTEYKIVNSNPSKSSILSNTSKNSKPSKSSKTIKNSNNELGYSYIDTKSNLGYSYIENPSNQNILLNENSNKNNIYNLLYVFTKPLTNKENKFQQSIDYNVGKKDDIVTLTATIQSNANKLLNKNNQFSNSNQTSVSYMIDNDFVNEDVPIFTQLSNSNIPIVSNVGEIGEDFVKSLKSAEQYSERGNLYGASLNLINAGSDALKIFAGASLIGEGGAIIGTIGESGLTAETIAVIGGDLAGKVTETGVGAGVITAVNSIVSSKAPTLEDYTNNFYSLYTTKNLMNFVEPAISNNIGGTITSSFIKGATEGTMFAGISNRNKNSLPSEVVSYSLIGGSLGAISGFANSRGIGTELGRIRYQVQTGDKIAIKTTGFKFGIIDINKGNKFYGIALDLGKPKGDIVGPTGIYETIKLKGDLNNFASKTNPIFLKNSLDKSHVYNTLLYDTDNNLLNAIKKSGGQIGGSRVEAGILNTNENPMYLNNPRLLREPYLFDFSKISTSNKLVNFENKITLLPKQKDIDLVFDNLNSLEKFKKLSGIELQKSENSLSIKGYRNNLLKYEGYYYAKNGNKIKLDISVNVPDYYNPPLASPYSSFIQSNTIVKEKGIKFYSPAKQIATKFATSGVTPSGNLLPYEREKMKYVSDIEALGGKKVSIKSNTKQVTIKRINPSDYYSYSNSLLSENSNKAIEKYTVLLNKNSLSVSSSNKYSLISKSDFSRMINSKSISSKYSSLLNKDFFKKMLSKGSNLKYISNNLISFSPYKSYGSNSFKPSLSSPSSSSSRNKGSSSSSSSNSSNSFSLSISPSLSSISYSSSPSYSSGNSFSEFNMNFKFNPKLSIPYLIKKNGGGSLGGIYNPFKRRKLTLNKGKWSRSLFGIVFNVKPLKSKNYFNLSPR